MNLSRNEALEGVAEMQNFLNELEVTISSEQPYSEIEETLLNQQTRSMDLGIAGLAREWIRQAIREAGKG